MAACSDQDAEEKVSDENCISQSQFEFFSPIKGSVRNASPTCLMSKNQDHDKKLNKETDAALAELPEDELQKLLEEAVTFNRPSSEDSYLLQKLKEEHAELCKDVNQHSSLKPDVSGGTRNRQPRSGLSGTASKTRGVCMNEFLSCNSCVWSTVSRVGDVVGRKRSGFSGRSREDYNVKGIVTTASKQRKSQSSLDLTAAKSDPFDMMRSSGKGKGGKGLRGERAKSLSDSPSEVQFLKDNSLHVTRTSDLPFKCISSSVDTTADKSYSLRKTDSSAVTNKRSVHIPSNQSDLSSLVLDGLSNHLDSTHLTIRNKTCDYSLLVDNQEKIEKVSDFVTCVNPSDFREEDLRNMNSCPEEFEMKEIRKSKSMEEQISEKSHFLKAFPLSSDSCYSRRKSDGDGDDIRPGEVEVDDNTAMPRKLLDYNAEFVEKNIDKKARPEASYQRPQFGGNIMNFGISSSCSVLDEGLYLSSPLGNKVDDKIQKKKKKGMLLGGSEENRILPNLDINGNNRSETSELFSPEAHLLKNDRVNRKSKRSRGNLDNQNVMLAKDIAGHRWEENIDSLLAYINSSDKKGKGTTNGNNALGHVASFTKPPISQELEKKREKVSSKENKNVQNCKNISNNKKNSKFNNMCVLSGGEEDEMSLNSDKHVQEENSQSEISKKCNSFGNSFNNCILGKIPKAKSLDSSSCVVVNCFEPVGKQETINTIVSKPDFTEYSSSSEPSFSQSGTSVFYKDFYSTTEVDHESMEETEFRVVVKKRHKKRHLPKKSLDSFRRHSHAGGAVHCYQNKSAQKTSCNELMLLNLPLSHRSQRGRQSTSSVPPSEHSSAENSDLDSVHSLPVCNSAPPPTSIHPHTTPSSSSSTPQTSYADITRMSMISSGVKLKPSNNPMNIKSNFGLEFGMECNLVEGDSYPNTDRQSDVIAEEMLKTSMGDGINNRKHLSNTYTYEHVPIINKTDLIIDINLLEVERNPYSTIPVTTALSFSVSSTKNSEVIVSSPVVCTEQNNSTCLIKNLESQELSKIKELSQTPAEQQTQNRFKRPPVIIMDNCIPEECVCDLTFGFEINEQLLRMSLGEDYAKVMTSLGSELHMSPDIYSAIPSSDNSTISTSPTTNTGFSGNIKSSYFDKFVTLSGHYIQWREPTVNIDTFNYSQIVQFFGWSWDKVLKDYERGLKKLVDMIHFVTQG
ncbi:uncharacterized protein LOC143223295 isoform X2 [Tachypleus tridentatus]|uniref:uncharacterized protein LOC143223295 isoform X2 n=1 Tax=Tachypleus tridentatus TaxID=6853 RepID=UPI003FD171BE